MPKVADVAPADNLYNPFIGAIRAIEALDSSQTVPVFQSQCASLLGELNFHAAGVRLIFV